MGDSKTETKTTIPGASNQETEIRRLMQMLAEGGAGQLGDLSKLAQGDLTGLGPSGQDTQLVADSIGRARSIGEREANAASGEQQARLGELLSSMGMQGSSSEFVQRGMVSQDAQRMILNMIDQAQMAGGQALMNLPFQRANVAMSANQSLFNQIAGMANPLQQSLLQERMAQPTETQTTSMGPGEMMGIGAKLASNFIPIVGPAVSAGIGLLRGGKKNEPAAQSGSSSGNFLSQYMGK